MWVRWHGESRTWHVGQHGKPPIIIIIEGEGSYIPTSGMKLRTVSRREEDKRENKTQFFHKLSHAYHPSWNNTIQGRNDRTCYKNIYSFYYKNIHGYSQAFQKTIMHNKHIYRLDSSWLYTWSKDFYHSEEALRELYILTTKETPLDGRWRWNIIWYYRSCF